MKSKFGMCQLCGEHKKLMRAHVISRSLFKQLFKEHKNVLFVAPADLNSKYRIQDAFFDDEILCQDCDSTFSPFEKYYNSFIRGELLKFNKIKLAHITSTAEYYLDEYDNVDTHKLRLFFLITLWRSSISKQPTFKVVDVGDQESVLATALRAQNVTTYAAYPVILLSLKDVDDYRVDTTVSPRVAAFGDVPIIIYLVNGWVFIYCERIGAYPFLFEYRIVPGKSLKVIRVTQDTGVFLLNQLTMEAPFRRNEIQELIKQLGNGINNKL